MSACMHTIILMVKPFYLVLMQVGCAERPTQVGKLHELWLKDSAFQTKDKINIDMKKKIGKRNP